MVWLIPNTASMESQGEREKDTECILSYVRFIPNIILTLNCHGSNGIGFSYYQQSLKSSPYLTMWRNWTKDLSSGFRHHECGNSNIIWKKV